MTVANIEEALNRTPFAPFELHLDNGRTVPVKHPDFLMFSENRRTVIVTEGERFIIADVDHISALTGADAD